jgi:hypothetical protein
MERATVVTLGKRMTFLDMFFPLSPLFAPTLLPG